MLFKEAERRQIMKSRITFINFIDAVFNRKRDGEPMETVIKCYLETRKEGYNLTELVQAIRTIELLMQEKGGRIVIID